MFPISNRTNKYQTNSQRGASLPRALSFSNGSQRGDTSSPQTRWGPLRKKHQMGTIHPPHTQIRWGQVPILPCLFLPETSALKMVPTPFKGPDEDLSGNFPDRWRQVLGCTGPETYPSFGQGIVTSHRTPFPFPQMSSNSQRPCSCFLEKSVVFPRVNCAPWESHPNNPPALLTSSPAETQEAS
jgi:hypothetical protein